jgi:hypothetical protein
MPDGTRVIDNFIQIQLLDDTDTNGDPMPMPPTLGVAVDNGTASVNADGTGGQETPATVGTATLTATLTLADGTVFTDAVTDSVQAAAPVLAGIKIVMD